MCLTGAAVLLASAGAAGAASAETRSVELRDVVARVTVVPEDRADVKVEFLSANPKLPITVSNEGGRTIVDGGLDHRIRGCHRDSEHPSAHVRGVGRIGAGEMPQVVIRTPKDVVMTSDGAVFGSIGRSTSLEIQDSGCNTWTIADSAGDVRISESGAGAVRMGSAERLELHLSGAADVHAVRVRQGMTASLSGAGDVKVEDLSGPVKADVSGLGHVRAAGGHVTELRASVSGVGGMDFGGVADNLHASISGLGGIRVKQVTGSVTKSVSGLGHVTVDQPRS